MTKTGVSFPGLPVLSCDDDDDDDEAMSVHSDFCKVAGFFVKKT